MAAAELFLSAIFSVLFERLASPELLKFAVRERIRSKLNKWESTLKIIEALLMDAEEKQLTDRAAKIWLDDLRDLAYDIEDVLDEFATEALHRKLKADHRKFPIPVGFSKLSPPVIKFNMSMRSKIKEISSRLDEIHKRREVVGLKEIAGRTSTTAWERPPSTSLQIEPVVYGRDEDRNKILEMALNDGPKWSDAHFLVIPIVGMGGIGKTTLARKVYNDEALADFNPKAWVCVSDDSDVLRITSLILQVITPGLFNPISNLEVLQKELKKVVAGKRFLLVLDDVWNMNDPLWESLMCPFKAGAPGSTIIVTTRHEGVASMVAGPGKYYKLRILSDDHCWSLFMKHAFQGRDVGAQQNLELIHQKVVEKCRGLPLVARTLGGLLHSKRDDEWTDILNNKIWDLSDENGILPVLKLSYQHLPSHLKRCFSYCAIIPRDYEFEENELVLLWMAEGLIQESRYEQSISNKQLEDAGSNYFQNLVSRSIFQPSSTSSSKFTMHDLVHDLARWVARDICFRLEDESGTMVEPERIGRTRHSSYSCSEIDAKSKFDVFHKFEHLRTFLPMQKHQRLSGCHISTAILVDLLPKLKRLRILSLKNYRIEYLPRPIGSLRHLRFLNLSNTDIRSLPMWIGSLINLQILILRGCSRLFRLPFNMRNLINLQYLDVSGSTIKEMPMGMKELKSLVRLSNFIVGNKTGSSLNDLKYLNSLRGELSISGLSNVVHLQDAREPILSEKQYLEVLLLEWRPGWELVFDDSRRKVAQNVFNMLQPHRNLKNLTIRRYYGREFSSWLGDPSFFNMVALKLEYCGNCTCLPPLGLLGSLRSLSIKNLWKVHRIGLEIYGEGCSKPFQSLESLSFKDMLTWEHWEPFRGNGCLEAFPHLRELSISNCPRLSGQLPEQLPSLERFVIRDCTELAILFSSLPMIRELDIKVCKQMAWRSPMDSKSLKSLSLSNVSIRGNWLRKGFQKVESLGLGDSKELGYLQKNKTSLQRLPEMLPGFNSLKELHIGSFNALTSLPTEIQHKGGLETLKIEDCTSLEYVIRGQPSPSLRKLNISRCQILQCLFNDQHMGDTGASSSSSSVKHKHNVDNISTSLLKYLCVEQCPSLTCLTSTGQLPAALTNLEILDCSGLMTLVSIPKAMKFLKLQVCSSLKSIAERFEYDASLECIWITDCGRLESLPEGLHTLSNLHQIIIWNCQSLVPFPGGRLPNTIVYVSISSCPNFKALPSMHGLNSLQELAIVQCPGLVSFPEEGFPTSLKSLEIEDLHISNSLFEWGLHNLTSLAELRMVGWRPTLESFPPNCKGMFLPPSLTVLSIVRFPNLKYLSSEGFQNLNSLRSLTFIDCPKLTSLPVLPSSLLRLEIYRCPLLEKRCKRNKGPDWSKIRDIPCVVI